MATGSYKTIKGPIALDVAGEHLQRSLFFLSQIRRAVLIDRRSVFIDLSAVRLITAPGAMMLAAEIDRCRNVRPRAVAGCDPHDADAREMLNMCGFYELLGIPRPDIASEWMVRITSGIGSQVDVGAALKGVATVAEKTWGDAILADRVHGALNEAITNVIHHAYPASRPRHGAMPRGKWWVAGLALPQQQVGWFFALDHGEGIPGTAPSTMATELRPYLADYREPTDVQIVEAVIKERRSRSGQSYRARGLTAMIKLIETQARAGSIEIISGRANYRIEKVAEVPQGDQITATTWPLTTAFPGTLIIWRIEGPRSDSHHAGP
ncbi:MAG: hypothetical protein JSR86_16085 [Proteobacteria bacterium]|nr:hypothetical protein [Pseudomonadota bacterium]